MAGLATVTKLAGETVGQEFLILRWAMKSTASIF